TIAFGQFSDDPAAVDIPLSATDGTNVIALAVGLDLTATNGIDPALGETDLPPFPPAGVFECRFDLFPYAGSALSSYFDYRNAPSFPYTGVVEHTLWFQTSAPAIPIDISYDIPTGAEMMITDQIGGSFLNIGPFTGVGVATIPGSYTAVFGKAFVIMDYDAIVPVELTSFTAGLSGQTVILNWTTATEINNQGFEIERHTVTNNWEKIGYVPGFGTTSEPKTYSYTDDNIVTGTYTYRLKQVDYDGTFSYSDEVEVEVDFSPSDFALFQNYPNPFNPSTLVRFQVPQTSSVTVKIYDMLGQEVRTLFAGEVVTGTYTANWNGLNDAGVQMSSGSYIYKMVAGDFVQTMKMVLLK
ncbi:MAG: T9SS C-terminal target domain-containing protein, partial [Ignavibacteriae bacterium]